MFKKFFALILVAGFLVLPSGVQAQLSQQQGGLIVSPPTTRLNMAPGETATVSITLSNHEQGTVTLDLTEGAVSLDENAEVTVTSAEQEGTTGWISFPSQQIVLEKGEMTELQLPVEVPLEAEIGTYFPTLNIESKAEAVEGSGTAINTVIMHIMGINVINTYPSITIEVTKLAATDPVLTGQLQIDYEFTNVISGFTRPTAKLQVLAPDGSRIWEEAINSELSTLMPGQSIRNSVTLGADSVDLSQFGSYKVELLVIDDQFGTATIENTSFFVIPGAYVAAGILGVLTILVLLYALFAQGRTDKA